MGAGTNCIGYTIVAMQMKWVWYYTGAYRHRWHVLPR